jgi:hypothetical protein
VRVGRGQASEATTSASTSTLMNVLIEAAIVIRISRPGTVRMMSTIVEITVSVNPPRYPAERPRIAPMLRPTAPARNPIFSVSGRPATITASRLRPWSSVPSRYRAEGGCPGTARIGCAWRTSTTNGPTSPISKSVSTMTRPTTSSGLRRT